MKILFYSDNLYPEMSGISDSIISLGRELKRRGHEVAFAGPRYSRADYAFIGKTPDDPSPFDGFEVCRLPSLPFGAAASGVARFVFPFGYSFPFIRRSKPDIIHTQTPFGTGIEALAASRIFKIPLVGTNHTRIDEFIKIYGPIRTDWATRLANKLFVLYYNRSRVVSAPHADLLDRMKRFGLAAHSLSISNPTSLDLFSPAAAVEKADLRRELGVSGKIVIYSGRLAVEKKIDLLVEAIGKIRKDVPDASLVIAGRGPAEASLRALVLDRGLSSAVRFTGFLDHVALSKWYRAADAFAIMCPIETQCLSLMQAFAVGLPCAGVDKGAVGEHIRAAGCGEVVPENDVDALVRALTPLLADEARMRSLGAKSLAYIQRFSAAAVAQEWEKVYEDVKAGASGRRSEKPRKATIVIPAYNEEASIAATLRAALAQTYPDFEIVVVDNASTDKTAEAARAASGGAGHVRIVHEPKKGLLSARERGRKEARGAIIVNMDADCLPDPDWLARGIRHFDDPRIVAVAGPYFYHDADPFFKAVSLHMQKHVYRAASSIIQSFGRGAVLIGGNSFIRADVLEKAGGYDTSIIFYGEDTDTARRVAKHGWVLFDPKLIQPTSARRFKSEGSLRITALYLFHFFRVLYKNDKKRG